MDTGPDHLHHASAADAVQPADFEDDLSVCRACSPIIHIGLHKTGSSFLQQSYFIPDCGYHVVSRSKILEMFINLHNTFPVSAEALSSLAGSVRAAQGAGQPLVFSHERLSGYPSSGAYDRSAISHRIAQVFPKARVLIVVREQSSLIYSFWKQSIVDGGDKTLREFLARQSASMRRQPSFTLDVFDFEQLYDHYCTVFSEQNVLLLPYEDMKFRYPDFMREISAFCQDAPSDQPPANKRVNTSRSNLQLALLRLGNKYLFRTNTSPRGLFGIEAGLGRFLYRAMRASLRQLDRLPFFKGSVRRHKTLISKEVGHHFHASNRQLDRRLGLGLDQHGYY